MCCLSGLIRHVVHLMVMLRTLVIDATHFLLLCLRPGTALAAENLFLRKQLALYQDRQVKPRRATDATRFALVWLSLWFDWPQALTVVQPATFRQWRRQWGRLFWRGLSCPGRPPIPGELQGYREPFVQNFRSVAPDPVIILAFSSSPEVCFVLKRSCKHYPQS